MKMAQSAPKVKLKIVKFIWIHLHVPHVVSISIYKVILVDLIKKLINV